MYADLIGVMITLGIPVRKVLDSNVARNTGYPAEGFYYFLQSLQENVGITH
jgi:hypothetical protein